MFNLMNTIVKALLINHRGASLLLTGDVKKSTTMFQEALEIIRSIAIRPPPQRNRATTPTRLTPISDQGKDLLKDQSRGFIYSKPFFFNHNATVNEHDIASYAAIITFNLGLAYHLEGQASRDGGKFLLSAKGLYETTLELLNREWVYDCSNVIIATLNNLACVHAELAEMDNAKQVLFVLSMFLKEGRIRLDTLAIEDLRDVVLNLSLLTVPSCAGAA